MAVIGLSGHVVARSLNDASLHNAIKENADVFNLLPQGLPLINDDYANAEKYLQSKNIPVPFSFKCEGAFTLPQPGTYYLSWNLDEHQRYRLHAIAEPVGDKPAIIKPVLESTVRTRLALYPFLPKFIRAFAAYLTARIPDAAWVDGHFDVDEDEVNRD